MTKEIPLSRFGKNKGKFVAIVDDADFEVLSRFHWSVKSNGYTLYAYRVTRPNEGRDGISVFMHREIMHADDRQLIDHIDRNGLNNTRANLRCCSPSENSMNRKTRKDNILHLKGVKFNRRSRKWSASIKVNGKVFSLGYFNNPDDAARAYDKAALNMHGEFACLNFHE